MCFGGLVHDGKTKPGAIGPSANERLKQMIENGVRNSIAGVGNRKAQPAGRYLCAERDPSAAWGYQVIDCLSDPGGIETSPDAASAYLES